MAITYVQFNAEVSGLGTSYSVDKHAKTWTVEERGSWFVFTKVDGTRRRVPVTAVTAVHDTVEDKAAKVSK